ncbi:hypothetical protein ACHAXT_002547 [Thalassiosira profunda]
MKARLSPKRKPSSGARNGSLSRSVSKAAKRVASFPAKVTSRKKRSTSDCNQDLGMAPPLCNYATIGACKASSRSSSPLFDEEVKFAAHLEAMEAARQNDPLQKGCHNETDDDGFSLSSPLCFSLGNVLSPSGPLHFKEEDIPGFQEFQPFLRQPDASGSSLFVKCSSRAPVSPLDGDGDVTEGGPDNSSPTLCDQLRLSTDMSPEPEDRHDASPSAPAPLPPSKRPVNLWHKDGGTTDEEIETTHDMDDDLSGFVFDEPSTPDANTKEAADSTLAWGSLSAILGSPAPTSVKKKKRRQPVNLWLDDSASACDNLEDIMLPSQDDNELGGNIPDLEIDEDADDDCSIPCMTEETATDNDAVPQLDCVVPNLDDAQDLPPFAPTTPQPSKKDVADSTLAWTALAAILGSPAPSSVVKKNATKARTNLWEDGEVENQLPEIVPGPEDETFDNEDESLCVPSVVLEEPIDLDELPESEHTPAKSLRQEETTQKEAADSVLAWSALGMLLGSPTPKAVAKKSRKPATNLWDDGEGASEEDLDDLVLGAGGDDAEAEGDEDEEEEDSSDDIPSLSGTVDEDDDDHSIPSLSADSPVTVGAADLISAHPKLDLSAKKEAADSVLAWSALGMLLGSPAPKATQPRRNRRGAQDLWGEEDAIVTNLFKAFSLDDDVAVEEPPCTRGR